MPESVEMAAVVDGKTSNPVKEQKVYDRARTRFKQRMKLPLRAGLFHQKRGSRLKCQ
jgi:hypothetical protein